MTCPKCNTEQSLLVNGVCLTCDPRALRLCVKCGEGHLESKPQPNWMNRFKCDKCGYCKSR